MNRKTPATETSGWRRHLRRHAGVLTLAFGVSVASAQEAPGTAAAATAPAGEATPALGSIETLWKTNVVDAVLRLRTCPETGICGSLHWVNPDDRRAFDYFGDQDSKKTFRTTRDDILSLCDYAPAMQFNHVAPGRWEGKLHIRGRGVTVNMQATVVGDNQIQVVASKAIFSERDTWIRIAENDPRYPRCTPARP